MSKDLNQCNFIGRLGRDVEMRVTPAGAAVASFSIACSDDYKDKQTGQKVEHTEWVNITAFGKLAEICAEYLHKGKQVYISGKYTTRKWQDNDGKDRWTTSIKAENMQMLGGKNENPSAAGSPDVDKQAQASAQGTNNDDSFDDDIEF